MKITAYAFIVFSVVFSIFTLLRILLTFHLFDFINVYYHAIYDITHHINPYTDPTTDNNYPPTAFLFFLPFSVIPLNLAEKLWTVASFGSFLVSIFVILKTTSKKVSFFEYLLIYSFAMLSFPVKFTLGMGQINFLILLFLSLCFYYYQKQKPILAGTMLSLAAAIKLTPLILLLFFIRKREWKIAISTAISFLILILIGIFLFDIELTKQYFFNVFPNIPTAENSAYYNQAFTGLLARLNIPSQITLVFNYSLFILLLIISFIFTKIKKESVLGELTEYGLFMTAILIGAGLAWQHHFVLLIIPYAALFLFILQNEKGKLALLLLFSYLLVAINIKDPQIFTGISQLLLSHVLYGTLFLYILLISILKR